MGRLINRSRDEEETFPLAPALAPTGRGSLTIALIERVDTLTY